MKHAAILVLSTTLIACTNMPARQAPAPETLPAAGQEIELAARMIGTDWPASVSAITTTDGDIYLGNLNSQINVIQGNPGLLQRIPFSTKLAGLLYQRFQIEGRMEDAEQARDLLYSAQAQPQFGPADHLVYAKVLLGFHDFEGATKQIGLAESENAAANDVEAAREALDRALRLPVTAVSKGTGVSGNYVETVHMAAAQLNRGQLAESSQLLRRAQEQYRDSSPLPLAWIHVQQGIAFLRHGEYEHARTFFAAAHERFPQYFLATEHLAETEGLLGNHARSAELYRLVTAQNNQPGFWHGLAGAEAQLGNSQAASDATQRAAAGYQDLLERYPLMFADHAVGYYLDVEDPQRALELAELNVQHRQDVSARLALAEALAGNGLMQRACEQVTAIRSAGLAPPEITVDGEALASCP